jgi:mannosyltransferase OCH1-like enzyme
MIKLIILLLLLYLIYYIFNSKYNNILPKNDDFNIFTNYYDLKELIHLHSYNNELKNIMTTIPKYIKPRNDIPIVNKYELIKNDVIFDDYFFVIYYLNDHKCKIIVRRLDSYQLNYNFCMKIYDINNNNYEIINFMDYKTKSNEIVIEYQTKIKLDPVIYKNTKIPKVIVQTGNSVDINLAQYNTALTFIELNPEYTYVYFDENDRQEFITNHFDKSVINAYNKVIPGAYKADLFRYCYMYINGGCYFDNKMINRIPIRNLLNENDKIILCDDKTYFYNNVYNAILLSIKNNIIFKKCIVNCVYNINNHFYGSSPWDISGPKLLLQNCNKNKRQLYLFVNSINLKTIHKRKIIIKKTGEIFCNTCYYQYYDKYINPNHYLIMWLRRKIYK